MSIGRMLIIIGAVLILTGLLITIGGRFFGIGRLPGDIVVRRQNFTLYFPIVTSLLLSVLLTLVMWLLTRR